MSLLREIQAALMEEGRDLGPIFLKLRYLAARLGSNPLEDWVKHESEGYPVDLQVPPYRILDVSYTGTFSGSFGAGLNNAPIPSALINLHAGEDWTRYSLRQSISAIDELISAASKTDRGNFEINASNLILLLQGKIYEDYACNSIVGTISQASLAEVQHVVRTRILELTLELEAKIPAAAEIEFGPLEKRIEKADTTTVTKITNQVIHGNMTTISNSGDGTQILVQVAERDENSFREALELAGIPPKDAEELTSLIESEEAASPDQPWGEKTKAWIAKNIGKAVDGSWKVGIEVATKVITEAAMKYYGFK